MKKYILLNYFSDFNQDRKSEYLFCVQKNLNLKFITKLFKEIHQESIGHQEKIINGY